MCTGYILVKCLRGHSLQCFSKCGPQATTSSITGNLVHLREQNLPPQYVSLWHEGYFRLITFKKQATQEVFFFNLSFNCLK